MKDNRGKHGATDGSIPAVLTRRRMLLSGGAVIAAGLSVGAFAQDDGHKGHDHSKKSAEAKEVTVQGELIDTACFVYG